ncbi:MAG TPA: hypothetical protein VNZ53_44735 [Steroidobacteraceae bacterium]|jgi:hypothetical protein|nr:hypothetical protein [Steroidobacteraceae bacterium]
MDNEHSGSMSSGSGAVTSAPADIAAEKIGLSARAGAALSKVSETAQQAGTQVKEAATSLATEAGEEAKGFIDQQAASGADFLGYIGHSARVAADTLDPDAPQLAGLVRGMATSVTDLSPPWGAVAGGAVGDRIRLCASERCIGAQHRRSLGFRAGPPAAGRRVE